MCFLKELKEFNFVAETVVELVQAKAVVQSSENWVASVN